MKVDFDSPVDKLQNLSGSQLVACQNLLYVASVLNRRDDIAALTREAADISGIQYLMDVDAAAVDEIHGGLRGRFGPQQGRDRLAAFREPRRGE